MESNHQTPKKFSSDREFQIKCKKTPITTTTPKNIAKYILLSHNHSNFISSPSIKVIKNPFESQLHERLHLPMISSPSLFQLSTPNNNEEFTWSIEDLSVLRPQTILPHSKQFEENIDPLVESQAQAAISTFFKEHINVPSPQDCWLRKQKIVLKDVESPTTDIINSTEISTRVTKKETSTQTQLSFPPVLTKEIEDLLKKFQVNDEGHADTQESNDNSMMDISTLRRKLFIPNIDSPELDEYQLDAVSLSPPPRTPDLDFNYRERDQGDVITSANFIKDNCVGGDMFGELSPIQKLSPVSSCNVSSMDVSMKSNEKTPSRVFNRRTYPKKNLSESFCMMQNIDYEENEEFNFIERKSSTSLIPSTSTSKVQFARFDSGFPFDDDLSNDMQF